MNTRKNKVSLIIVGVIILGLLAFGVPYMISLSGGSEGLIGGETITPPPSNEIPDVSEPPGDPAEEPGTSEEVIKEPDTSEEVNGKPDTESASDPDRQMIYVGEQLKIPVHGGNGANQSIIIKSGVLQSNNKQIALTFDAGWLYDQTIELLDVLDAYQVKSTFFLRGKWVEDHPQLAKEILKRGHSVESHSLTHGHMREMTDAEVRNEISATTKIIEDTTGYRPYLFRPPFGEYDSRILNILAQQGYPYTIMWTIDSLDWLEERNGVSVTAQYLTDRILSNATDKGIVLMHVGGYQTVNALPDIIQGLRNDGYKLVKVNDMLPQRSTSEDVTVYTVKQGDTLNGIARKFGVSAEDILAANPNR